jgi:hypothetical protein
LAIRDSKTLVIGGKRIIELVSNTPNCKNEFGLLWIRLYLCPEPVDVRIDISFVAIIVCSPNDREGLVLNIRGRDWKPVASVY